MKTEKVKPPQNLRTPKERNQWRKDSGTNPSGYVGVSRNGKSRKFKAQIRLPGFENPMYLGTFKTKVQAAIIYDSWSIWAWGDDAFTNILIPSDSLRCELIRELGDPSDINAALSKLEP